MNFRHFVILAGAIGAMIKSFPLIASRSGLAKHILDIEFGATDQYTFDQLLVSIDLTIRRKSGVLYSATAC